MDKLQIDKDKIIMELKEEALSHVVMRHPYLSDLKSLSFCDNKKVLREFAESYTNYSSHFPKYLTAVISKLEDPKHRLALIENLTEESGIYSSEELSVLASFGVDPEWIKGIAHPVLFKRFALAVGADLRKKADLDVICWREQFYQLLLTGSVEECLGALGLGTEFIVKPTYENFLPALENSGISMEDYVFFPLHTLVDDHHNETIMEIIKDLIVDEASAERVRKGMIKALMLRCSYWDSMLDKQKRNLKK